MVSDVIEKSLDIGTADLAPTSKFMLITILFWHPRRAALGKTAKGPVASGETY